jgi:NADH-quinone oxidoreductase subunit K
MDYINFIHYFNITFSLGLFGLQLHELNLILYFMNLEVTLISISMLYFIGSLYLGNILGQLFTLYILTVAGCESAIALLLIILQQRIKLSIALDKIDNLRN